MWIIGIGIGGIYIQILKYKQLLLLKKSRLIFYFKYYSFY